MITAAPVPGGSYQWQLGGASGSQTILDGRFQLFAKDITDFTSTLQGRSPMVLVLSRGSDSREFALSYRPSEIYAWQDLQAMRQNTAGAYTQMADISFPDTDGDGLSDHNFQPIGHSRSGAKEIHSAPLTAAATKSAASTSPTPPSTTWGCSVKTGKEARITDIVLEDVYVEGRKKVGAAVGEARISLPEGSFTGEIRQDEGISGGLVGSSKSHELSVGFVTRSDFSYTSDSYSSIVGGSIHYARNFSRNWAWIMSLSGGTCTYIHYIGADAETGITWGTLSTGVRYKTAWAIPVNVYGYFDLGFGIGYRYRDGTSYEPLIHVPLNLGMGCADSPGETLVHRHRRCVFHAF